MTVGTALSGRPPYRSVRAALPHTALTSSAWRRSAPMDRDAWFQVSGASDQSAFSIASMSCTCVGSAPQGAQPGMAYFPSEGSHTVPIARYSVVVEVACNHRFEPRTEFRDRVVAALHQLLRDFLHFRGHALGNGLTPDHPLTRSRLTAIMRETEKGKRLWPTLLPTRAI